MAAGRPGTNSRTGSASARWPTSLGGTHTVVSHVASTTHRQFDDAALAAAGMDPGAVRFSIGLEDAEDLIADVHQALERSAVLARGDGPPLYLPGGLPPEPPAPAIRRLGEDSPPARLPSRGEGLAGADR